MAKLILSAFSDEHSDSIIEQCKALNSYGINYTELRHANAKNVADMTEKEVKEISNVLCDYNIKVSSIGSPIGKIKLSDDFNEHLFKAERVFETANTLGAKLIRIFSFYPDINGNLEKNHVFDNLYMLLELSKKYGVTLCHENEAKIFGESPENCIEIFKAFKGEIKCVFDMGNFVLDGFNPLDAFNLLFPYIEYFHIKDALYAGAIVPAGKGEAQIKEILDVYKTKFNKDTFITLEPHLQTFSGLNALVGKAFDNPYKYENQQVAFSDAVSKLKELL